MPLFWYRNRVRVRNRTPGESLTLDTAKSTEGMFSLLVTDSPCKTISVTAIGTALVAQPNIAYRVKSIVLSGTQIAAGTGTGMYVTGTIDGATQTLAYMAISPLLANSQTFQFFMNVQVDPNTVLTLSRGTQDPATMNCTIYYDEIVTYA
jgi:broad specificity polyphosphatase/5'/3'-nucleotidase SurE